MTRATPLALAGLLLAVGLATAASAQSQLTASSTQVNLESLEEPIPRDGLAVIAGRVTYSATGLYNLNAHGTTIHLKVADAPDWAVIAVSPTTITLPMSTSIGQSVIFSASFEVQVSPHSDAPAGESGLIRIVAHAEQNGFTQPSAGEDQTIVRIANDGKARSTESNGNSASASDEKPEGKEGADAEGPTKAPASGVGGAAGVGLFGLSGAILGLVARTAFVRQKR